jgi:hypothetical protein
VSPCSDMPCLNDGLCFEKELNSFECQCSPKYYGKLCEYEIVQAGPRYSCTVAGFSYFNNQCYKLFEMKLSDLYLAETTCEDEESTLIQHLDANSTNEILYLASLIEVYSEGFKCIVTGIKRSTVIFFF